MKLRAILGALMFWLAGSGSPLLAQTGSDLPALTQERSYPESIATGIVVETDFAAGTMVIEGYRYRFAPDIPVQIGGSASSVTMLTPGMKVQFRFLRVPDDLRELVEIREIPPGVDIQRL